MISAGEPFPAGSFQEMTDAGPKPVPTEDIFAGKKVVLFHVVGAFTPTCSVDHLPPYISHQEEFLAKGVDSIVCFSTNDAMVMQAWNQHVSQGKPHKVRVLADGNGDVVKALGMELDATGLGLGPRGQRFAMIVEDGVVSKVFVEENPALATVTSAAHLLGEL